MEIIRWLGGFGGVLINSVPDAADRSCKPAMHGMNCATNYHYMRTLNCVLEALQATLSLYSLTTTDHEATHDSSCFLRCIRFQCEAAGQKRHLPQRQVLESCRGSTKNGDIVSAVIDCQKHQTTTLLTYTYSV